MVRNLGERWGKKDARTRDLGTRRCQQRWARILYTGRQLHQSGVSACIRRSSQKTDVAPL